eukprot:TRINITY_DN81_c1_g1_i7.p1 TRINITY_DN81_c1_g1~~TRINITY_DN81_c1_g1_i7.p1  ORF type:complete len:618 (-),score=149.34 TRINITY_DN81_c1_g1_i7:18-1787(-)
MLQGEGGGSGPSDVAGKMDKVEAELEEVKAKIAALEAKIEFYEHATRNKRRLTSNSDRSDEEEDTLQNLERFLARPLDGQGNFLDGLQRQLAELQGMLKELQREKNLLLEEKAALRRAASQSATVTSVPQASRVAGSGSDPATGVCEPALDFAAGCLSAARAFVTARGPEAPWDELVGDLPDLPLGSTYTTGLSGACARDEGRVTHDIGSFLHQGEVIKEASPGGEVKTDVALGALFAACTAVGGSHSCFNVGSSASKGAGNKGTRPDTRITVKNFDIARGESKADTGDLQLARIELTSKMRPWSAAYYGDLPGILGIATRGHRYAAVYIARDGASRELASGSFGEAPDAIGFARLLIAVVAYARVRIEDEKWGQKKDGVWFRVGDDGPHINKNYGEPRPNLVDFYAESSDVLGLERGKRPNMDMSNSRFLLEPHGCSRMPHRTEARAAMRQIVETVAVLHGKGWAHRDLRWANIVLDCCKEGRRWTVIDCEYAARIGTSWADSNPPKHGWNEEMGLVDPIKANDETVTVYRDYWMLGEMIARLEGLDSDGELAGIGEELRAAVGDTYPDVDAANKARKDGFERLRTLK